jgi:cytochrome b pre-mRNA-processing protein 3
MVFGRLWTSAPDAAGPATAYEAIVAAARRPGFYADLGAPDTLPGRFELVVLHVALTLRRLRAEEGDARAKAFAQELFDAMFRALDANLRELGVGDITVPKRVKAMARSFYDGAAAYDRALDAGDEAALAAALRRIVYAGAPVSDEGPARLARYAGRAARALAEQSAGSLIASGPVFPPLEESPT